MADLNQGQTGKLRSTPKIVKINGDDHSKVIYRNSGNNHAYPFVWATSVTVASGEQSVVVASGIKIHGYELATYATMVAMPEGNLGYLYMTRDTVNNVITLYNSTAVAGANTNVSVIFMLGSDFSTLTCRSSIENVYP